LKLIAINCKLKLFFIVITGAFMKTLNEIKTHFKQLVTAINAETSTIAENQAILMQLEESNIAS
jgi:hypothetical protein